MCISVLRIGPRRDRLRALGEMECRLLVVSTWERRALLSSAFIESNLVPLISNNGNWCQVMPKNYALQRQIRMIRSCGWKA